MKEKILDVLRKKETTKYDLRGIINRLGRYQGVIFSLSTTGHTIEEIKPMIVDLIRDQSHKWIPGLEVSFIDLVRESIHHSELLRKLQEIRQEAWKMLLSVATKEDLESLILPPDKIQKEALWVLLAKRLLEKKRDGTTVLEGKKVCLVSERTGSDELSGYGYWVTDKDGRPITDVMFGTAGYEWMERLFLNLEG